MRDKCVEHSVSLFILEQQANPQPGCVWIEHTALAYSFGRPSSGCEGYPTEWHCRRDRALLGLTTIVLDICWHLCSSTLGAATLRVPLVPPAAGWQPEMRNSGPCREWARMKPCRTWNTEYSCVCIVMEAGRARKGRPNPQHWLWDCSEFWEQFLTWYDHVSNLPTSNSYSEQHGLRMTEI